MNDWLQLLLSKLQDVNKYLPIMSIYYKS